VAGGHRDILRFLLEGDALSAEATLRRHLRGAVTHLLERFQAPAPPTQPTEGTLGAWDPRHAGNRPPPIDPT
jgi:hypothetical protein